MAPERASRVDEGSATVEFVGMSIVLIVPLVYLVLAVFAVQSAAFAAEAAARDAARGAVMAGITSLEGGDTRAQAWSEAVQRATAAGQLALEGFSGAQDADLAIACAGECLAAGSSVEVTATVSVRLPGVPGGALGVDAATITVTGAASAPVDGLVLP